MEKTETVRKQSYIGLFLITLATLMYEILLTRIFSVTMWYHFAFMAISITMFGMTVGAILVYLFPGYFTAQRAKQHLSVCSLLFAVFIIFSFLTHLCIPFPRHLSRHLSLMSIYSIMLSYSIISLPFIFSGITVCLALTKFPKQVSRLYAADLLGAAAGCVLFIFTLRLTDGPTAVFVVALFACIGAVFFITETGHKKLMRIGIITIALISSFIILNSFMASKQQSLIRLMWVKGAAEQRPLYEKWNSFSRVTVIGNPDEPSVPLGYGISPTYKYDHKVKQMYIFIDAAAETTLTHFDGDFKKLDYLKYDIVNLVHYIKSDSKVLAVGSGGGRDILSALMFGQKSVLGVEINDEIVDIVTKRYRDFAGRLDEHPKVKFVNDEARSFIARSKDKFDIIQVSLIDTWAATAAGAFVLTENALYTVEAWKLFLEHLTDGGVLTFSRWYFRDRPGEVYRLASLANAALKEIGVKDARRHIIIARVMKGKKADSPEGVGTILVSKSPFSDRDIGIVKDICGKMKFEIVLSPSYSLDPTFADLASGKNLKSLFRRFPINISPPTDNNPFFFHMLRLRDIFKKELWDQGGASFNMKAVLVLGSILITVVVLTSLCIIIPLILTTRKNALRGSFCLFVFFAAIGLGFMMVEISQMQRLIVFLGHPTYSLTVVLFSLLLSSGLGSYSTHMIKGDAGRFSKNVTKRLMLLLGVLAVFGLITPYAITYFQSAIMPGRILLSVAILFPLGFFMGMPFPIGMKVASSKSESLTPWLWGINGATSVCASVLAIVIALAFGISASFWVGFSCYVVGFIALMAGRR